MLIKPKINIKEFISNLIIKHKMVHLKMDAKTNKAK